MTEVKVNYGKICPYLKKIDVNVYCKGCKDQKEGFSKTISVKV